MTNDETYFCPLLRTVISEGRCVDINYVLNDFVNRADLKREVLEEADLNDENAAMSTCENCIHYPLERTEDLAGQRPAR